MKFFFLVTLIFIGLYSNAQLTDTIHWRANYKLKWSDYKGVADSNSTNAAITSTTITFKTVLKDSTFIVTVFCYFNKPWSWTKFSDNNILLKHEQGHFDIAELFARKFRMILKNTKLKSTASINIIYSKIQAEKQAFNSLYDKETDYCNDVKKQIYWSKKILAEINKLNGYKN